MDLLSIVSIVVAVLALLISIVMRPKAAMCDTIITKLDKHFNTHTDSNSSYDGSITIKKSMVNTEVWLAGSYTQATSKDYLVVLPNAGDLCVGDKLVVNVATDLDDGDCSFDFYQRLGDSDSEIDGNVYISDNDPEYIFQVKFLVVRSEGENRWRAFTTTDQKY